MLQGTSQHQCQDTALPGIPDGYAASDYRNPGAGQGQQYCMGANIKVESNTAIIEGVERYTGAQVSSPDLRAGAALVIAGLAADGITIVDDIHFIERGYERFDEKLRSLGAEIEKVEDERALQKFRLRVG